jgi:hypothetical protein
MELPEFKRILTSFADEPADVDLGQGRVTAYIRNEVIDVELSYSSDDVRSLYVTENDQRFHARSWILHRVAMLPQLADRLIASTTAKLEKIFIPPAGYLSQDIARAPAPSSDIRVDDAVAELEKIADLPIPGATSVIYLTSDAGEGKTTVINKAAQDQAINFKAKRTSSLIVPIPLSGKAFLTFDDAVVAALVNRHRFGFWYFDAFIELVKLGAIVPAFDGYEEMLVVGSKGEAISALGHLVQALDSSGTILVAARKALFEYLNFKTQAKLHDAVGDRAAVFGRLELERWDRRRFIAYGTARGAIAPEEVFATVQARLGPAHPLLTRAVMVRRLFEVIGARKTADELMELFGRDPQDYFFTFVEAIVNREANEKWLFNVSGDIMEPLLTLQEHHRLLSQIATEMWRSSSLSLRPDVLDLIVELFAESEGKGPAAIRQVKERIKQHSLLIVEATRTQALSFDHEDFQNFYLGEGLGELLHSRKTSELQSFLAINSLPSSTIEQAVQHLLRRKSVLDGCLGDLKRLNQAESGFSFCRENCSAIALRITECLPARSDSTVLEKMFFSTNCLEGRSLRHVVFQSCHFQPTTIARSNLEDVTFRDCEFELLELGGDNSLSGCKFVSCRVDSVLLPQDGEQTYDPQAINSYMLHAGAATDHAADSAISSQGGSDEETKLLGRFLRIFSRSTHVDEDVLKLRLGKGFASVFMERVLPRLLSEGLLTEVTWKGQGVQRRYRLAMPLSTVVEALEASRGSFEQFLGSRASRN